MITPELPLQTRRRDKLFLLENGTNSSHQKQPTCSDTSPSPPCATSVHFQSYRYCRSWLLFYQSVCCPSTEQTRSFIFVVSKSAYPPFVCFIKWHRQVNSSCSFFAAFHFKITTFFIQSLTFQTRSHICITMTLCCIFISHWLFYYLSANFELHNFDVLPRNTDLLNSQLWHF